jgi:hypothetical protein
MRSHNPFRATEKMEACSDVDERVWLPGNSPVSGGRGQLERQLQVLESVPAPPRAISMHFRVPSYQRRGHFFDMESLGYVVLASWRHDLSRSGPVKKPEFYRPESIWLTMVAVADEDQGVELGHDPPPVPEPDAVLSHLVIADPARRSIRGTVIPEFITAVELSGAPWLGLDLTFGADVDIGEFGFLGAIKPLIDAMTPLLGVDSRGGPADHRVHDMRIRQDARNDGSVDVRCWYCSE